MKITTTPLEGLLVIQPTVFQDTRGFFFEGFKQNDYSNAGMPAFVQDNFSRSSQNTLRGLHYQLPNAQGKLVGVTRGTIWDVAVDIRRESKTFGQWFSILLSDDNHTQLYIPPGFAHGFCVLSDIADFYYKCTEYYHPRHEHGIAWNDKDLNINWPISEPILSAKDAKSPTLAEIDHEKIFA